MKIGITVIICSFIYTLMVFIIYSSKKKVQSMDNKLYNILIKFNIFGLILELLCCYFVYNKDISNTYSLINVIVNRVFLINILTWLFIFTTYVIYITFNNDNFMEEYIKINKKKIVVSIIFIYLFLFGLVSVLPLNYFNDGINVYSYGLAANVLLTIGGLSILIDIFCLLRNIKGIRSKKYLPVFALIVCMIFAFILRSVNPGLIVINSMFAFISILMYFTIENPDLQMVNELVRNKEIAEKSIEEKSNFLFKMTNEVKSPINNILCLVKEYKEYNGNIEEQKKVVDHIEISSKNLVFTVNDILNISSMDIKKIKVTDINYDTKVFFNDLDKKIGNMMNGINYNYSVSSTIPSILNGDYIKLKQILLSLINNIIKNNEVSNIDIEVSSINKYGVTRLILDLKCDTSLFTLSKINDLVECSTSIENEDEINIDKLDMSYELIFKVLKLMGGNFNITSDNNETSFIIVIDQKDVSKKQKDSFEKFSNNSNSICLLSDNVSDLELLSKKFKEYEVTTILDSKELIEKIKNKNKYRLIIMKDEMDIMNAYTTIQNLMEIDNFKTKCIVILDKNKESIKEHYIKDGFVDYILISDFNNDIERIKKKYL